MSKRIGILTSGGDCAGLNAAIRAVTYHAVLHYGWTVVGIKHGTRGLMELPANATILHPKDLDTSTLRAGGTFLGTTNKGNPLNYPRADGSGFDDRSGDVIRGYHDLKLDALIGIGGDGSQDILCQIAAKGNLNLITIPKTIDNDVGLTEHAIGFMTAVNVATEALDKLQPTAASHDRVMLLEVMGRDAGHIALMTGIAGGADVILIPEIPYTLAAVAQKIKEIQASGRNFATIVVAEALAMENGTVSTITDSEGRARYSGISHYLADQIAQMTGAETRFTVLGHIQRGGEPLFYDRVLASAFGVYAVDLINEGKFNRMVGWQNRGVVDVAIQDAISAYQAVDTCGTLVRTARSLGISFGD